MHKIQRMRDKLCDYVCEQMERGLDKVDTQEMGMAIDMIKDLAEAEKCCNEAEYYDTVVDAMDGDDRYGYVMDDDRSDRMGYRNSQGQYARKPSRRRMRRSGYSDESVEGLRRAIRDADPERRKLLMKDLEDLMQEM